VFTAIVWIGTHGSWSQGGYATHLEALRAALDYATRPGTALTERQDLVIDAEHDGSFPQAYDTPAPVAVVSREIAEAFGMTNLPNVLVRA
jgi:hypothetical protein